MLLADTHQLQLGDHVFDRIVEHLPTPQDLNKKTLKVSWEEEASFDEGAGIFWPGFVAEALADRYRQNGHFVEGISAEVTFPPDDSGCVVTFKTNS